MGYFVRLMQPEDIPQLTEIDREAFPTDWPPVSFKRELENRLARYLVICEEAGCQENPHDAPPRGKLQRLVFWTKHSPNKGTSSPQPIIGYATLWFMVDEAHLTSIAVREKRRRQGLGELLLISVLNLAIKRHAQVVTLEVRASNLSAQALYEKYSFNRVGIRRRYYSDNGEDAILMSTEKLTSPSYQARFQELKEAFLRKWREYHPFGD